MYNRSKWDESVNNDNNNPESESITQSLLVFI